MPPAPANKSTNVTFLRDFKNSFFCPISLKEMLQHGLVTDQSRFATVTELLFCVLFWSIYKQGNNPCALCKGTILFPNTI